MSRQTLPALDLDSVGPVFVPYTVTDADLASFGPLPSSVTAQAKLKFLPYRDAADAIAEKFHSDVHFLEQLNPGKMKTIKAGDQLMVPNVEPFELGSVKEIKPGSELNTQPANDVEYQSERQSENADKNNQPKKEEAASTPIVIKIDTKTNMLGVFQGDKLIAAYPGHDRLRADGFAYRRMESEPHREDAHFPLRQGNAPTWEAERQFSSASAGTP